jgi:hypothetical protein
MDYKIRDQNIDFTQEEFEIELEEIVSSLDAKILLSIPAVYDVLRDEFYDEVVDRIRERRNATEE